MVTGVSEGFAPNLSSKASASGFSSSSIQTWGTRLRAATSLRRAASLEWREPIILRPRPVLIMYVRLARKISLGPPSGISAVDPSSLMLQKFLQAQVLLFESFCVFHSHVTVMPGLPPVARLLLFAPWIGQNKSVLPGVMLEPPVSARLREGPPDLVACGRVREINRGTELMLAVSRCRTHPIPHAYALSVSVNAFEREAK